MQRSNTFLGLVGLFGIVGAVTACGTSGSSPTQNSSNSNQSLPSVKIAQTSNSLGWAANYIAVKEGFFKKEGVNVTLEVMPETSVLPGVASGGIQFGAVPTSSTIQAITKGEHFQIVAPYNDQYVAQIVVSKQVAKQRGVTSSMSLTEKLQKLKGVTVATLDIGGGLDILFNGLVKEAGMDPNTDFQITAIHSYTTMLHELKANHIDVAILAIPYGNIALSQGYSTMLADFWAGQVPSFAGAMHESLFVSADYAKQNPQVVESVRRAMNDALQFIHQNPQQALTDLEQKFPSTSPDIIKQVVVDDVIGYPSTATVSRQGFESVKSFMVQNVNPSAAQVTYAEAVYPSAQEK